MLPFIFKIVKQFRKAGGTTNDFLLGIELFCQSADWTSIHHKFHLSAANYCSNKLIS